MVATTGTVPVFAAVKEGKLPVPEAARPMEGSLFVQLYTATGSSELVNVTALVGNALHTTWLAGWVTVGGIHGIFAVHKPRPCVPATMVLSLVLIFSI